MILRDHLDEIIEMRVNGATLDQIGSEFGVTRERVRQLIPNLKRWNGKNPKAIKAAQMRKNGYSIKTISEKLGACRKTVDSYISGVSYSEAVSGRFWRKVDRSGDCWEWNGSKLPAGYGHLRAFGRDEFAHRMAYKLSKGDIPDGMVVMHSCDNPACCNPDHLILGTQADNVADRDAKGRGNAPRGERSGNAVLTEKKVIELRHFYSRGLARAVELASIYSISVPTVYQVVQRKSWKHVTGEYARE